MIESNTNHTKRRGGTCPTPGAPQRQEGCAIETKAKKFRHILTVGTASYIFIQNLTIFNRKIYTCAKSRKFFVRAVGAQHYLPSSKMDFITLYFQPPKIFSVTSLGEGGERAKICFTSEKWLVSVSTVAPILYMYGSKKIKAKKCR